MSEKKDKKGKLPRDTNDWIPDETQMTVVNLSERPRKKVFEANKEDE